MAKYQAKLLSLFPSVLASLKEEFLGFDTHIMVVEPDDGWYTSDCTLCGPGCDPDGVLPDCGADLGPCDNTFGAGTTFPTGKDSSAQRCPLAQGRFVSNADPDIDAAFQCVAKVGIDGGIPRPADAMVAAISPPLLGINGYPTGCNQGFLRDDALLVVTIITNIYDDESSGPADAWRDALMDAKHQDAAAFQVLVITTDIDINGVCDGYSPAVNRIRTFVELTDGLIGSICADSYVPFFDDAVTAIVERCNAFVPQ